MKLIFRNLCVVALGASKIWSNFENSRNRFRIALTKLTARVNRLLTHTCELSLLGIKIIQLHVLNLAGLIMVFGGLVAVASGAHLEIVLKESLFVLDVQQRIRLPQVGPRKHQLWEVRVSLIIVDGFEKYFFSMQSQYLSQLLPAAWMQQWRL